MMVKSDGNGDLIVKKQFAYWASAIVAMLIFIVGFVSYVNGVENRVSNLEGEVQPFEQQIESFYTRREGEKLEENIVALHIKVDTVLETVYEINKNNGGD